MKKLPIHEIEEFRWPSREKFLRRDHKSPKRDPDLFLKCILFFCVFVLAFLLWKTWTLRVNAMEVGEQAQKEMWDEALRVECESVMREKV